MWLHAHVDDKTEAAPRTLRSASTISTAYMIQYANRIVWLTSSQQLRGSQVVAFGTASLLCTLPCPRVFDDGISMAVNVDV
jgi:hypothetical protein